MKALNLLVVISALVAIYFDFTANELFVIFKPLTTALVILIAVIFGNQAVKKYWQFTVLALLLCLIGDVFLLKEDYFVFGLASFLIGHILLTLSFIALDGIKRYGLPLIMLSLFGIGYYLFLVPDLGELAIPVLFYFLFIILMCWQGVGLVLWRKETAFKYIAIGVLLFLVSDAIIALNKFKFPFASSGILILSTYWLSITLLANAAVKMKKI